MMSRPLGLLVVAIFALGCGASEASRGETPEPTTTTTTTTTTPTTTTVSGETAGETSGDPAGTPPLPGRECASDADCVPSVCCHPTSCVPATSAPECDHVACTDDCRGGTMDCGAERCLCQNGHCTTTADIVPVTS